MTDFRLQAGNQVVRKDGCAFLDNTNKQTIKSVTGEMAHMSSGFSYPLNDLILAIPMMPSVEPPYVTTPPTGEIVPVTMYRTKDGQLFDNIVEAQECHKRSLFVGPMEDNSTCYMSLDDLMYWAKEEPSSAALFASLLRKDK